MKEKERKNPKDHPSSITTTTTIINTYNNKSSIIMIAPMINNIFFRNVLR